MEQVQLPYQFIPVSAFRWTGSILWVGDDEVTGDRDSIKQILYNQLFCISRCRQLNSTLLKAACDRSLRVVTQVCSDSKVLYAKSKQAILDAIEVHKECIRILQSRLGDDLEDSVDDKITIDRELFDRLVASVDFISNHGEAACNDNPSKNDEPEDLTNKDDTCTKKAANVNKKEISEFYSLFKSIPSSIDNCPEIQKLASLISDWFVSVFDKKNTDSADLDSTGKRTGKFLRYKRSRIHEWVEDIVIGYGKARKLGKSKEFSDSLKFWLNQDVIRYPVPSDIYEFSSKLHDEDISLEAVAIWYVLYDNAFYKFENLSMKHGFSRQNIVNRFYDSMSPVCATLDGFEDLSNLELLRKLHIFVKEDSK